MSNSDEISLIDLFKVVIANRMLILATFVVGTAIGGGAAFLIPKQYQAVTTLLPIEKTNSNPLAALSNTPGLGFLANQAGFGGSGGASMKFMTILNSRTLRENVSHKVSLETGEATPSTVIPTLDAGSLRRMVKVDRDLESGVVRIQATSKDPDLSARIANTYARELDTYLKQNAISSAKRNRQFVEEQLRLAQEDMAKIETALKTFQQKNRVIALDAQTEASVRNYAEIKARLTAAEIEAGVISKASFEGDPKLTLKLQEIQELKKQLAKLEAGDSKNPIISFESAPSLGLSYARLKRDLMVREKVFELLTQQTELAKIQEAQEDISFHVLDPALPSATPSSPKVGFIVLISMIVSGFLGLLLAFGNHLVKTYRNALKAPHAPLS